MYNDMNYNKLTVKFQHVKGVKYSVRVATSELRVKELNGVSMLANMKVCELVSFILAITPRFT